MIQLTMTELKYRIGAISYAIRDNGESFILSFQGKPFAKLGPIGSVRWSFNLGRLTRSA